MSEAKYETDKQFHAHIDAEIVHGFFTRRDGVSSGLYEGLNCGPGSGDDPQNVQENRKRVAEAMGADIDQFCTLYQVHGDQCLTVDAPWEGERPQADAMVTDRKGILIGVLTADCTPVLFAGHKADGAAVVGAAHAGWKGALGGILDSTLKAMHDLGAADIRAAIGPCIARKSYEVSEEFFGAFEQESPENEMFFNAARREGHLMFDMPGYVAAKLKRLGLSHISLMDRDTYSNEDDFYSYRRATHRGEKDYGRQVSVIMIN